METTFENPSPLEDAEELDAARAKAALYPIQALARAYRQARDSGKHEVADILREALKDRT